jgi:Clostripain family
MSAHRPAFRLKTSLLRIAFGILALALVVAVFLDVRRANADSVNANWRVLIYMAADNDLDPAAIISLAELQKTTTTGAIQIAAQIDRSAKRAVATGGFGDTRRFRSTRELLGNYRAAPVADLGPTDSGSIETLKEFVAWGMQAVPGQHTLLILWGHGRGDRGLLIDETTRSHLQPDDVKKALEGQAIDVLAMDSCSMQTLGVATVLANTAQYLVGSPSPRHALGWPYAALLGALDAAPEMTARDLATWLAQHAGDRGEEYTGSALDLRHIPALSARLKDVFIAAKNLPMVEKKRLSGAIERLQAVAPVARTVDLDAALTLFEGALPDVTRMARKAHGEAVIAEVHSAEFADTRGLAIRRADLLDVLIRP